jgi:hypothetical protein
MNVQGPQVTDLSRFFKPRPQDSSSTANDAFKNAVNSASLPAEQSVPPVNPQQADTVTLGSVSLDLNFARSESLSRTASVKDANGSASLRQDLSRSYESELKIDFSFAATAPGTAEKLANLDPAIMADWQKTAADLKSLNPQDYNDFVKATDSMFNEIEKALGMGSTGLDYAANFFKDKVGGFINDVNKQMDYFNNNPLGSGPDMGLNIPGLFDSAKQAIPGDLVKYLDQVMKDLEKSNPGSELLKQIKEVYKQLIEKLTQPQTGGLDPFFQQQPQNIDPTQTPSAPNPGSGSQDSETAPNDKQERVEEYSSRYSSYTRKSVSSSILLSYVQQQSAPAEDKSANTLALTA